MLQGWDKLLSEVKELKKNKKEVKVIESTKKEPDIEPFWRPKTKERTSSSGIRLGGKVL